METRGRVLVNAAVVLSGTDIAKRLTGLSRDIVQILRGLDCLLATALEHRAHVLFHSVATWGTGCRLVIIRSIV